MYSIQLGTEMNFSRWEAADWSDTAFICSFSEHVLSRGTCEVVSTGNVRKPFLTLGVSYVKSTERHRRGDKSWALWSPVEGFA